MESGQNGRLCETKGSTEAIESCAELPPLCLELIFSHLDQRRDAISAGAVCQAWHHASVKAPAWSKVDISWPDFVWPPPRSVSLEAPYRPSFEAAFVSFLMPRASAIRVLAISRGGPVTNKDNTAGDGFADTDAICNLVAACTNLQHLDLNITIALPKGGPPEHLLVPALETALKMCPCLTLLRLPNTCVIGIHPRKLSRVETLFVYPMASRMRKVIQLEEVLSEMPALKVLNISSLGGSARLRPFRLASVESLTIVGKVLTDGFDLPNLGELHAECFFMGYQVKEGFEKLHLPPRLQRAFSNWNFEESEAGDSFHFVA